MENSSDKSKETHWHIFRYRWTRVCNFIYLCSAPGLVLIVLVSLLKGDFDGRIVLLGMIAMVVISLMAYSITRVFYLQISETGLRQVSDWPPRRSIELKWQDIKHIDKWWPCNMYVVSGPGLFFGKITIVPWLMEHPLEFCDFVEEFAPAEMSKQLGR